MQKRLDRFSQNSVEKWQMGHEETILVVIPKRSLGLKYGFGFD